MISSSDISNSLLHICNDWTELKFLLLSSSLGNILFYLIKITRCLMKLACFIVFIYFQGQFRSTVMCLTCKHRSRKFDAFNCLQLQLSSNHSLSLEVSSMFSLSALHSFSRSVADMLIFD